MGSLVFYSRTESVFYTPTLVTFNFEGKKRGKVLQISLNQAAKIHIHKKREFIFKENKTTKPM